MASSTTPRRTHYETLQLPPSASADDIKRQYQKLALEYHPDKAPPTFSPAALTQRTHAFRTIHAAYATLRDPALRDAYDDRLRSGAASTGDGIVHSEVDLDDMEYYEEGDGGDDGDRDGNVAGSGGAFIWPCRCGGRYIVREQELEEGVDEVMCSTCSLRIRVLYRVVDDADDDDNGAEVNGSARP
ncbi:DnaJ domain-containing protein [Fimicolochytrium jonesii]|uniref:DnaJ domain-containing protein n=1 Tax=Fimicolochytrium jonesii TaxID=1396493 RepID=UPI0022FDCDF9|nr:DnaJ domain-containing protein [Fimicolochytrium jonesii]KAI8821497.1 DnaJ domain-containing protein [Fimicolochytrium jonesii]